MGMALLGVPIEHAREVMPRWIAAGKPPLQKFSPYFKYLYSIELFYYLAISADLISRVRPAEKADNKVDIAYLYYLPFCMVFVSNDNLHERVVPLFLREDQTFVNGQELKADLRKIDEHFAAFPDDEKAKGMFSLAPDPPADDSFLVTQLWNKHLPGWQKRREEHEKLGPEDAKAVVELINRISEEGRPVSEAQAASIEDMNYAHVERQILRKKGKWVRVPPGA